MWKRLKLVSLIVLSVLLAWLSFPTWRDFVVSATPPASYTAEDRILLIVPDQGAWTGTLQAVGQISLSQGGDGSQKQEFTEHIDIRANFGNLTGPEPETVYLVATGAARSWVDHCHTNGIGTEKEFNTEAPESVLGNYRAELGTPSKIIAVRNNYTTCDGPGSNFWTSEGAAHTFSTPYIDIVEYPMGYNPKPAVQSQAPTCAQTRLGYGPGINIDYQYPGGAQTGPTAAGDLWSYGYEYSGGQGYFVSYPNISQILWSECLPTIGPYEVEQVPIRTRVTDIEKSSQLSKTAFFAGAFIGVIGGLSIEIIGSGFEVAEATAQRRRARRGEGAPDPIPEPPPSPADDEGDASPEPWNPGSGGYL